MFGPLVTVSAVAGLKALSFTGLSSRGGAGGRGLFVAKRLFNGECLRTHALIGLSFSITRRRKAASCIIDAGDYVGPMVSPDDVNRSSNQSDALRRTRQKVLNSGRKYGIVQVLSWFAVRMTRGVNNGIPLVFNAEATIMNRP